PFLTWDEIREVEKTGLVEIASHTDDLHRYVPDNPWGDTAPATTTRLYRVEDGRYETRDEYPGRVRDDPARSASRLRQGLGHDRRVVAWPYGEFNAMAGAWAREAGFPLTLGLEGGPVAPESLAAGYLPRIMIYRDTPVASPDPRAWISPSSPPARVALVALEDIFDPDTAACVDRVDRLVARARAVGARE